MIVRWIGAFGKNASLCDSLIWELTQSDRLELCAEKFSTKTGSNIDHVRIGLLSTNSSIVKKFSGDCWSIIDQKTGKLKKTRNPKDANGFHSEVWIKPHYTGIVIKGRISDKAYSTVMAISKQFNLPVIRLSASGKQ